MVRPTIFKQVRQSLSTGDKKKRMGVFLYWFAWGIEILAACVGWIIAGAIIIQAREKTEAVTGAFVNYYDQYVFAVVMIMCGFVELCKIPMATAFYYAQNYIWKTVFLFGLFVVMLTTFETVFNAFERSAAFRLGSITELVGQKNDLIKKNKDNDEKLSTLDEDEDKTLEYDQRIEEQRRLKRIESEKFNQEIDGKLETSEFTQQLNEQKQIKQDAVTALTSLTTRRTDELDKLRQAKKDEINFFDNQIAEQRSKCEEKVFSGSCKRTLDKFLENKAVKEQEYSNIDKDIREKYKNEERELNLKINKAEKAIAKLSGENTESNKEWIKRKEDSKTSSLGSYDIRIAELKREQEEYKASFKDNRGRELEIKKDIEENNEGIIKIEKKLTREKGNSQIYRLTKWLFKPSSVNPETGEIIESLAQEITPEDLRKTFLIWFGSLSFIVATIGTFLAFGGLVLQDLRPSEERGKIRKVFNWLFKNTIRGPS